VPRVDLASAGPVDVVDLLPYERAALLDLLTSLAADEWDRETECPAWSVKGIALHLLGDDLSLLSRQRDGAPPGVVIEPTGAGWSDMRALDDFNEAWVEAARFSSPALLIDLLRASGQWTHRWYAEVNPDRLGEPVAWVSPDPAPYWLLAAREYAERWVHHLQIARAVGRPGPADARCAIPAIAIVLRGFPLVLAVLPAATGASVTLRVDDAATAWTLLRGESGWSLADGEPAEPTVQLSLDVGQASVLFSRGLPRAEAERAIRAEGDRELASTLVSGIAGFFGR
jgi:uncharacterized protein (TIGR03083 family)